MFPVSESDTLNKCLPVFKLYLFAEYLKVIDALPSASVIILSAVSDNTLKDCARSDPRTRFNLQSRETLMPSKNTYNRVEAFNPSTLKSIVVFLIFGIVDVATVS